MSNISGLYTALSGMNAQRRVLDVTAHNIANQATPGYHRQRVDLEPVGVRSAAAVFAGRDIRVGGVDAVGVSRIIDTFAEHRALRETAMQGGTSTMRTNIDRIERAFPEPSEHGIAATLDAYWSAWSDVSAHPDDLAIRAQLLDRAQGVVDALGRASADLDAVQTSSEREIAALAGEVNDLAARIATLNETIVASGETPNDLLDQRDLLVKELAALTGATARPAANGAVDVTIGGRAIVSGPRHEPVDGSSGMFRWSVDGSTVAMPPSRIASLVATVDDVVPRYRAALDAIAERLVTQVNAHHTDGYDLAGVTGRTFFDPTGLTAGTISISADVAGAPANVAAGAAVLPGPVAPGPLDGELARKFALLAEDPNGPGNLYQTMVAELGIEARGATQRDVVQAGVTLAANADAESTGGVSLDEEMANLLAAQRAYEASARVLTTVDQLLGILIERTGVVGR